MINYKHEPTENFNLATDTKLACTCGHKDCDKRVVNQVVVNSLQRIREDYKKPMRITSGGRCGNHPDEVKKDEGGSHFYCMAADIAHNGTQAEVFKLVLLLGRHGATRIAVGVNFIHGDWVDTGSSRVPTWKYVPKLELT